MVWNISSRGIMCGVAFMLVIAIFCGPSCADLKMAPEIKLKDFEGKTFVLSEHRGKVVTAVLWMVSCPHCKQEISHLIELHNKYKDRGLVLLGIAVDSGNDEKVKEKVRELGINYPVVNDSDDIALTGFGPIERVPAIFIISRDGKVYKSYQGYTKKEILEEDIRTLLKR